MMAFGAKFFQKNCSQSEVAAENAEPSKPMQTAAWVVTVLLYFLALAPVINMISSNQIMNTSFDPFDLVNTYGAFGTVGQRTFECCV